MYIPDGIVERKPSEGRGSQEGMIQLERGAGPRSAGWILVATLLVVYAHALPALGQTAPAERTDAIVGGWADERGEMEIEIFRCGAVYCGKIVSLAEPLENGRPRTDVKNPDTSLRERPLIGLPVISDLSYEAEGVWKGTMYAPFKGKQVNVTFMLDGPKTLRAEVSKFIFRKTLTWTRTSG